MKKDISDNRYRRVIKQCLNKIYKNKSSVNQSISKIIVSYSHKTLLEKGRYLLCRHLQFFVINKVLSTHWISGFFCPSELQLADGLFYYIPKFWHRSPHVVKKVFDPFTYQPFVKVRKKKYYLQRKSNNRNEQVSSLRQILQRLD